MAKQCSHDRVRANGHCHRECALIHSTTWSVMLLHNLSILFQSSTSYLIALGLREISSSVGVSDTMLEVNATSPFTHACFHDLLPGNSFYLQQNKSLSRAILKLCIATP